MHAQIMISIWPKFYPTTANYKELDAAGFMYKRNVEVGELDWIAKGYKNSFYDPYSEKAQAIYWRQVNEKLNSTARPSAPREYGVGPAPLSCNS
ncbi:hypothetical protein QUF31_21445 [Dickeya chrysanthemi]|nr:TIM-barrel domain-containing protein [Dickeya chrysanthemi]WJM87691.1 hypothetical protein QUF31_21445 [Dickeya chrysanthemi]